MNLPTITIIPPFASTHRTNVVSIPSTVTELSTVLKSALPDTTYVMAPGVSYTLTGPLQITAPHVSVVGAGNSLTFQGNGAGVTVRAADFQLGGFQVSGDKTVCAFRIQAPDCVLHTCDVVGALQYFALLDGKGTPSAATVGSGARAKVIHIVGKVKTYSELVYNNGADNVSILGCTVVGSEGEQGLRFSPGDDGHRPDGGLIMGCDITNVSPLQKAPISIRQATNILIKGNRITGGTRLGENTPASTVTGSVIGNIYDPDPTGVYNNVWLMAAEMHVDGNLFRLDSKQRAVSYNVGASKLLSCQGNIIQHNEGQPYKRLIIDNHGNQSDGTGTVVVTI